MDLRITKLKIDDDGRVTVKYMRESMNGFDEMTMSCVARAEPEFYTALAELVPHACELLEWPEELQSKTSISGILIDDGSHDKTGLGITLFVRCQLRKASKPLRLKAPPVGQFVGGEVNEFSMSEEFAAAVKRLREQAIRYVNGHRSQVSLFAESLGNGESSEPKTSEKKADDVVADGLERRGRAKAEKATPPAGDAKRAALEGKGRGRTKNLNVDLDAAMQRTPAHA